MNWIRVGEACVAAIVAASLTDWLFFGVLFHNHYNEYPEVWRLPTVSNDERKAVIRTAIVCTLTPLLFVLGCVYLNVITAVPLVVLATGLWAMTAVPHLISNYIFIKLHPLLLVAHALGWLARFVVSAFAVGIFIK